MLWVKAFHIIFVVTWFAGLFYLPRLFIYHCEATDAISRARFVTMERRLLMISHIGAVLALGFGVAMLLLEPWLLHQEWMRAKLGLVAALIAFHLWCARLVGDFRHGRAVPGTTWLRWFNEIPGLLLIGIVCLVVVKPF